MNEKPFDTSILDAALQRRRLEQEQQRQAVLDKTLRLLDEWGQRYNIRRAYIFGSVTRPGHFTPESDIDIAIDSIDAEHFFAAMSALSTALGYDVDMVELEQCSFGAKIRREGILWILPA